MSYFGVLNIMIKASGCSPVCILGAQMHAMGFYKSNGYEEYGEEFLDANIPHMNMKKTIK